jgi:hypothetical protein
VAHPAGARTGPDDAEVIIGLQSCTRIEPEDYETQLRTLSHSMRTGEVSAPVRGPLGESRIANGIIVLGDARLNESSNQEPRIHTPDEIAERLGRISVKTLSALIRSRGLETTTLGHAPPSPKGGPPRRLWGMTDAQLECLLSLRRRAH